MNKKPYYQILRDQIRATGEELIARADGMVGEDEHLISDFSIFIKFDQDKCPTITYTTEVINEKAFDACLAKSMKGESND